MANFALGLEQGLRIGAQFGEAMRRKRMREAFEEAQADKQRPAYTPEQGAIMRQEAGTVEQPGEYEYTIEPGSTTYTRRRRGLSAEDEAQLLAAEAARDERGRPYYSVTRGPEGATVRGLVPTEGGGFNTIGPDTYNPSDLLNYAYGSPDMRRLQSDALIAKEEEMLRPARFSVGVIPGSESTVTPQATQYLGQTYGAEGLTPTQQRAALMNRYADIISKYESPVEGERFRSMARAEERAEETYGLTKRKAEREEKAALDTENVYKAMGEYQEKFPNATPMEIYDHLKKQKLSTAAINKVVADIAGVGENELKMYNTAIDKIIIKTGGSYAALKNAYNTNDMLDPTTNIVDRKTKDGKLVVDFVSADDPNKVLSSFTFNDETEAAAFLATNAKNPVVAAEMLVNTKYKKALTLQAESRAGYLAGGGARRGVGRDYTNVERIQEINGLVRHRDSAAREADRLREDVNNMRPNDRNYAQTVARYNAADALVQQLDRQIQDLRSGGGLTRGGGAAPKRYSIGDIEEATTTDGKKVKVKLVRGDGSREEDWEVLAPSSTKAEPKAEAEVKTAPAKEEPKAKAAPAPKAQIEITKELRAKIDKERLEMSEGNRMKYSPEVGAAVKQIQEEENLAQTKRREEEARRQIERDKQRLQGLTR